MEQIQMNKQNMISQMVKGMYEAGDLNQTQAQNVINKVENL